MAEKSTGAAGTAATKERKRFDGLVLKSTPSDEAEVALAKISIVGGTDVDEVVEFIKKSLAEARKQQTDIRFVKGTLTLS